MKRAWEIAKEGQLKFGGMVSEYLSESLKIAWKETDNKEVTVSWKNEKGSEIILTVRNITEEYIGYNEILKEDITRKVDKMEVTKLVIEGEEVKSTNICRTVDHKAIEAKSAVFRGQEFNITVRIPSDINEKVWSEYDKRQERRKERIRKLEEEQEHMNKVYSILECGA